MRNSNLRRLIRETISLLNEVSDARIEAKDGILYVAGKPTEIEVQKKTPLGTVSLEPTIKSATKRSDGSVMIKASVAGISKDVTFSANNVNKMIQSITAGSTWKLSGDSSEGSGSIIVKPA